tara:strand:+ start:19701 stop:20840 length:1140 start_codon:yes stop_codon:yes gene_type:complete
VHGGTIKIGIVAAEKSGDNLGYKLLEAFQKHREIKIFGVGGDKFNQLNISSPLVDQEVLNVMGLIDPLKNLSKILKVRKSISDFLIQNNIDIFIGVDAPDLNFYFHKTLKNKINTKNIQLVSPSVWGWRPKRIEKIKKHVDLTLSLFKFEHDYLKNHGANSFHLGHPFANQATKDKFSVIDQFNLDSSKNFISILPGSRDSEIKTMIHTYLETAEIIYHQDKTAYFLIPATNSIQAQYIKDISKNFDAPFFINEACIQDFLSLSDIALTTSGTATLEAVTYDCIPIICYKTNPINFFILNKLITSKHIGIPNLLMHKKIFPELIQKDFTPKLILESYNKIFKEKDSYFMHIQKVKKLIQGKGFDNAAKKILDLYDRSGC